MPQPSSRLLSLLAVLALVPAAGAQILFGPVRTTLPAPDGSGVRTDVADVDGDGVPDLVRRVAGNIRWHEGDGTGAFATVGTLIPGVSGVEIHLVDLDGDGREDLLAATATTGTLQVALSDSRSGFDPPVTYGSVSASFDSLVLTSGDADADGDADVLVLERGLFETQGEAWLFLNDGTGALALGPIVSGDATHLLTDGLVASVDGDDLPDLLVVSTSTGQPPETTAWRSLRGGGLEMSWRKQDVAVSCAADLDSDGDADLVAATHENLVPVLVSTFLGDGAGDFVEGPVTDLQLSVFGVVDVNTADFDADGTPDLVVALPTEPEAWLLRGDGAGGFGQPDARVTLASAASGARTGPCADFDADGRLDILATHFPSNTISVSLNETYPAGGPLLDLGHQLAAVGGWPIQVASGSFVAGEAFAFDLFASKPSHPVFHVLGLSVLNAPFKGGTMVPMPQMFTGPWMTTSLGTLHLGGHWPAGAPSGFQLALQFWFTSPGAVAGFSASSGVLLTTP